MKRVIITSLWLMIASYLCITGIFGNSGLVAMHNAAQISKAMEANILVLQEKNADFKADWQRLTDSPDMISQEGRSLGYLGANEVALTIKNKKKSAADVPNAGYLVTYKAPLLCKDENARLYAMVVGITAFLALFVLKLIKKPSLKSK